MPTVYRMHRASLGLCNRTWHQNRKIGRSDKNGRRTVYNSEGDGMIIRVSEVIRGWLGWCPNTQMRILGQVREPNDLTITSSGSRTFLVQPNALVCSVPYPDASPDHRIIPRRSL